MVDSWRRLAQWGEPPLRQGTLLLALLITIFLSKPIFTDQVLTVSDLLFEVDPLWQPIAPAGFTKSVNGLLSDQILLFYPWQQFAREEMARGRFALWDPPLWNPYVNSGHPFMGNLQSALYDPLHLLSFLVPLPKSLAVLAWLRLFVAGFFTLRLALELGLSRRAAYLAMIVFTFAMPQIVWLGYTKASVLAWLPALLFFSARLIRRGSWRDVTWLGLGMSAQLMGGHPEGSIYVGIAWTTFALYGLWFLHKRHQPPVWRAATQLAFGGLLGVGLSAVQWLPLAETVLQSTALATRGQVPINWQTIFWQWREWLGGVTLVVPDFFGNPRHASYWFPFSNYNEQNFFMGVTTLALALLALVMGHKAVTSAPASSGTPVPQPHFWHLPTFWRGPGAYFAGLGLVCLGLALRLPGFTLLAMLPGLHLVKAGRWRGIALLAIALLAGYGLDRYLQAVGNRHTPDATTGSAPIYDQTLRRWGWIVGLLGVGSALGVLVAWVLLYFNQAQVVALGLAHVQGMLGNSLSGRTYADYAVLVSRQVEQMLALLHPRNWPMYLPLWVSGLLVGAHWLLRRSAPTRRASLMGWLILLVVLVELWHVAYDYNPTVAREYHFPTPPLIEELRQHAAITQGNLADEPFRVVGLKLALFPNVNMIFGLEDVRGYEPSAAQRYFELMAQTEGAVVNTPILFFDQANSPLLDFLNVRYAFADVPLDPPWEAIAQGGTITLYTNPAALPRAFLVYDAQPAYSPEASLALTLAPALDLRQTVVLEVAADADADALATLQPPAQPGRSTITHYAPGEITLAVETAADGILVLSESYVKGWHATIDGVPAPLYVANHAFHALRVPAGRHTVTFTYAPTSVVVGAWISLGCLGVLLALLVWPRPKQEAAVTR